MLKCKECDREFETIDTIRRHRVRVHKINAEQTYIDYVLDGVPPVCKCGCGEKTGFLSIQKGFVDFVWGHAARLSQNNWKYNKESLEKAKNTVIAKYKSGELVVWNKGLTMADDRVKDNVNKMIANPDRGNKISKALSGVPKSKEHIDKIKAVSKLRWEKPEEREKQSNRLIAHLVKNNYRNKKTKLEETFENILNSLNIENTYQYQIGMAIFDFLIIGKNILIEVDGDFHHCNPNSIHNIPKFPIQIKTVGNDIRKNRIAEENNYKLLRFWEKDINERPEWIIDELKREILSHEL